MTSPRLVVSLLVAPLLWACPAPRDPSDAGPDDLPDAGAPAELALADLCGALAAATCAGFSSCGCTLEGRPYGLADCAAARTADCAARFASLQAAVDTGDLGYDGAAAAACVTGVEELAAACQRIDEGSLPRSCASLLVAPAALGESCANVAPMTPCASAAGWCAPPSLECVPIPGVGEPCVGGFCAEGLWCRQDDSNFTCESPGGEGAACVPVPGACAAGLACLEFSCRAPLAAGEGPCASAGDCQEGLSCDAGQCGAAPARGEACAGPSCGAPDACVRAYAERTCRAKGGSGAPCAIDGDCNDAYCDYAAGQCAELPGEGAACPSDRCAAGLACDIDHGSVCVTAPSEGQPCLVGLAACAPGLGCNTDNLCAAPGAAGTACLVPDHLCADGLACDFTADGSFCVERRGAGEHCESDVCADGLFCDFSTLQCAPVYVVGEQCSQGGECGAGRECGDLLGGYACYDLPSSSDAPCQFECGGELTCGGAGGVCAPAVCASP